jgi:hypothetical protein
MPLPEVAFFTAPPYFFAIRYIQPDITLYTYPNLMTQSADIPDPPDVTDDLIHPLETSPCCTD